VSTTFNNTMNSEYSAKMYDRNGVFKQV